MKTESIPTFSLINERWLPCIAATGAPVELNLRDTLLRAHEMRELRDASPLVTAALHRFLLAVLHRALAGPASIKDWAKLWKAGCFPKDVLEAYFARKGVADRFDLFDDTHPFYQVADFELPKKSPVTKLAHECASGNNATLFDHTVEDVSPLIPAAVCARWLVAAQAFALGGGVGATSAKFGKHPNFTSGPLVGGVMVLLAGSNLFHTLMLNLIAAPFLPETLQPNSGDLPAWERSPAIKSLVRARNCVGYLDLLTWQSRCIRLLPAEDGACEMYFAQGESLDSQARPREPSWFFRTNKDGEEYRVGLDPERALWRNAESLFAFSDDRKGEPRPLAFRQVAKMLNDELVQISDDDAQRCTLLGLANDQAKPQMWSHSELLVPRRLLNDTEAVVHLKAGLQKADDAGGQLRFALKVLAGKLLAFDPMNNGQRNPDPDMASRFAEGLQGMPRFWAALEIPFKEFLSKLNEPEQRESALNSWLEYVREQALDTFDAVSENSLGYSATELKARVEAKGLLIAGLIKAGVMAARGSQTDSHVEGDAK